MHSSLDETDKRSMGLSSIGWAALLCMFIAAAGATPVADDPRSSSAPPVHADSAGAARVPDRRTQTQPPRLNRMAPGAQVHPMVASKVRPPARVTPRKMPQVASGKAGRFPNGSTAAANLSTRGARSMPKSTLVTQSSPIGGPRVQTLGRVGGPVIARAHPSAAVDGAQFHRRR